MRPRRPLSESRLALVTTGGVHLPEQERFDIDDPLGDCSYREIPSDAYALTWTHATTLPVAVPTSTPSSPCGRFGRSWPRVLWGN